MAEGEFALVRQHLGAALKMDLAGGGMHAGSEDVYAMLVDGAAEQRNQSELRKYAPLAEETAMRIGHKLYTAKAHRAWGVAHTLAGEFPQAEARFQQALELFAGYPAPWQVGRTLYEMGELARARGQAKQARDYFSRALNAFEELGAAPYAERTRLALENLSPV
jgi:tetratricopeptide (TPR) repeat protein